MSSNQPGSRAPSAPMTGWKVVDQVQLTDVGPTGQAVRGWRISFQLGSGVVGAVFLPENRYSPDNVRAAIAAAAAQIDQVHQLSG